MRDNATEIDQAYAERAHKLDNMSAVDNMQSYAQIEQLRAQQVQKLVPAFQALYASLSDQQKQTADVVFRNRAVKAQAHRQGCDEPTRRQIAPAGSVSQVEEMISLCKEFALPASLLRE